jgi:hypothetical protein
MQVAYWIVGGLLALLYFYSGGQKILKSQDQLRPMMGWVDQIPMRVVRAIGVLEVLGAVGLVLPPLVGVAPGLAIAAADGFVVLQLAAAALHLRRGEARLIGLNVVLLATAIAAAWLATVWV